MPFGTAAERGVLFLYHWQPFRKEPKDTMQWLEQTIARRAVYCPSPGQFNDPWDCKPHFNTAVLDEPTENEKHVQWAEKLFRMAKPPPPDKEIERRKRILRTNREFAACLIDQVSEELALTIANRYRVYCLGTDPTNILMWSHYADSHRGICLEFGVRNDVICGALQCEYTKEFPALKVYSDSNEDHIRILRAKSEAWIYEDEYRLIAQERSRSVPAETLLTEGSLLTLPQGALTAVIVGCQGNYDEVRGLVQGTDPSIAVKRAVRVRNEFALVIEE